MAVYVVDHPLVRHKLGILRMESTSTREFRTVANEVARLLIYEATKNFRTESTWCGAGPGRWKWRPFRARK